jgi:hypothetical protein
MEIAWEVKRPSVGRLCLANALLSSLRVLTEEKIFRFAEIMYAVNDRLKTTSKFRRRTFYSYSSELSDLVILSTLILSAM